MAGRRFPRDGASGWSLEELYAELGVYEAELVAAGLTESSVKTYVEPVARYLRWITGDYQPR